MKLDIQYFASAGIYTTILKEYTYEQGKVLSVKVTVTPTPNDVFTAEDFENDFDLTLDGWTKANDGKGSYYKIYTSNTTETLTFQWYSLSTANYHLDAEEEIVVDEIYSFYDLTICIDKQPMTNPSEELKEVTLKLLEPLRSYEDVFDQLIIDNSGNAKVIRYIEKHLGSLRLKDEPTEETLNNINIELFEGDNYIYLKENKTYLMKAQYLTNCELNKTFATRLEMNSKFEQTVNGFNLIVSKKTDKDEIISTINQSAEEVKIKASKIKLEGYTTINGAFSVDLLGNMKCRNAELSGIFKNYDTNGNLAIQINDTNINFYDYLGTGAKAGSISSVRGTTNNILGINLYTYKNGRLTLGYKEDETTSTIKAFMQFDTNNLDSTPWIKNTASGTLFARNGNGITIENGLIKNWDIETISGEITFLTGAGQALTIAYKSGLITKVDIV